MAADDIIDIIRERGSSLSQIDLDNITIMLTEISLEDSDQIGAINEAIALIVNDPLYQGDIALFQ